MKIFSLQSDSLLGPVLVIAYPLIVLSVTLALTYPDFLAELIPDQHSSIVLTAEDSEDSEDSEISEEADTEISLPNYIRNRSFTLNGGGQVNFDFIGTNNGNIRIAGGRAELLGTFEVVSEGRITIRNLRAITGVFDASNNSTTSGSFYLSNDGTLNGTINGSMESREVVLKPID